MKNKATIAFIAITTFIIFGLSASDVLAINLLGKLDTLGTAAGFQSGNTLPEVVGSVIQALLSLVGMIFMGYIIYAGYLWMSARGNEEQLSKAKAIIRGSIIGLIIVMAAYAITAFVVGTLVRETSYAPPGEATEKPSTEPSPYAEI